MIRNKGDGVGMKIYLENKETATIEVVLFFPVILLGYFCGKLCRWFRVGKMIGDEL